MRRRLTLLPLIVVAALLAWALATLPPASLALRVPAASPDEPPTVRGTYHVHSKASDGTGTVGEIAAAAARAGLRFVILTDHSDGARPVPPPRYVGGVLCVEAVEISTTGGHYAAIGLAPPPYPLGGEARDVVEDVARLGGFGIAAHPDSAKPELRWREWDAPFDAMEWFNADSQWRDERRLRLLPALIHYPLRPAETVASLFDRPDGLLRRWDALSANRRVVLLAGADAHARMGLGGKSDPYEEMAYVTLPSYEAVFRAFSMRVELHEPWTGDAGADASALVAALKAGRVSAVFDAIAGPGLLRFTATSGSHVARQGGALALNGAVKVLAATNGPPHASLRLLRNGAIIRRADGPVIEWEGTEPGAYRVEAYLPAGPGDPPLPWILGNPIYVGLPDAPASRETPPPASARLVWPAGAWRIEKDALSSGLTETLGTPDRIRHTLHFQLGRGGTSPYVALATGDVGAMHDATRLAFRAGADRPMRLSVQVRLLEDGADRRWQRSVYVSPGAREFTIRFSDMRVAGTAARDAFDPARIHSLLFVVDTVNAAPGDRGVVWVEGLRTER